MPSSIHTCRARAGPVSRLTTPSDSFPPRGEPGGDRRTRPRDRAWRGSEVHVALVVHPQRERPRPARGTRGSSSRCWASPIQLSARQSVSHGSNSSTRFATRTWARHRPATRARGALSASPYGLERGRLTGAGQGKSHNSSPAERESILDQVLTLLRSVVVRTDLRCTTTSNDRARSGYAAATRACPSELG